MASMAYDISTGKLIDLFDLLQSKSLEELNNEYADKPGNYCCAECLKNMQNLSDAQLLNYRTSGLTPDSSFRRGGPMKYKDLETGEIKTTSRRPAFVHTAKLLDEEGSEVIRPCESDASIHHYLCRWIAESSGRGWLLGSGLDGSPLGDKKSNHVITVMARYHKEPSHREPDISVLWANDEDAAKELNKRFANGERIIDWNLCIGLTAVEVQKSQISKPELVQRTRDHLKHFTEVRWVFTSGNKPVPAREWLAEEGIPAFVIVEEKDKSKILGIKELPPPSKTKTFMEARRQVYCLRAVLLYWLSQGVSIHEAHARAKADLDDLKAGRHVAHLNVFEKQLMEIAPSMAFDPKQIWLRHQLRKFNHETSF